MQDSPYDVLIENGLIFDGKGNTPIRGTVAIADGVVAQVVPAGAAADLPRGPKTQVIDARDRWVMPGFIDLHTHYDAEVEVDPALPESLRHGVTTVLLGSCSLSMAVGSPDDLCDMYCRVEAMPDHIVRPKLQAVKRWDGHRAYFEHLRALPLGPNVASFVGHSAIRAHAMGLERSLDRRIRPSERELGLQVEHVREGLDEGYVGLSIQTLPWDKMGGTKDYRSRPLPSTFARWSEHRRLLRDVRERGRVFQGVPNVSTKWNVIYFMAESIPFLRKPLKTTVISLMDLRGSRGIHWVLGAMSRFLNGILGADFRWQALPEPFDLWADGIDLVVFEEFGAGARALHEWETAKRSELLRNPEFRAWFRRQWANPFLPKVFHRRFEYCEILTCPDASLIGKTFAEIGKARGVSAAEAFLDLVAEHGQAMRWYTVMANDRERPLEWIMNHPDVLIGFSDAGAHLRQMAHYNFPLRMLKRVRDAAQKGYDFMSVEHAVWRLTGELADWLGLDRGRLEVGARADVVVVNPEALDEAERVSEAPIPGFDDFVRLVRRNDSAVDAVLVNGRVAATHGCLAAAVGRASGFGTVLEAR
jgi:N-acyl-D-aspartate/D-glutamate deacylase